MATAVGNGFKIDIGEEYDTQTAEELKDAAYAKNPQYRKEETAWGNLIGSGWGQVVHAFFVANGNDDSHTVKNAVVRLGVADDGGKVYEVPNREHYDIGRAKNQPLYRRVVVRIDKASLAERDQAALDEAAEADRIAKEAELRRLEAAGANGDIEKRIAEARIKAGLGVKAKELTVYNGGRTIFTAMSPYESATAGVHKGQSIIDPGAWERIVGPGVTADMLGLPMPLLAFQPDGSVRPAKEEYDSVLAAARSQPAGPFQPGFSAAQISNARAALASLGIN